MKKYTSTLLALLLAGAFIGCSSGNDTEVKEEANSTTSTQAENQKMPTCYIKEGTPKTDSSIVVHVKCKNGNIPIDEAKVTLDNTVKSVDYKGVYFSDYIGFDNLQPSTTYKAVLEVVVGGKTIKESVKIKTREEKVVVTPTPTPTPELNTAPTWSKSTYGDIILPSSVVTIIDLSSISSDKEGDTISYKIINTKVNYDPLVDCNPSINDPVFTKDDDIFIEDNYLKIKDMPSCGIINIATTIIAEAKGGSNQVKITFHLDPNYNE